MEQKLKKLFDYQKFQKNPRLEAMLSEAEGRYDSGLSDDDLELVSAAGTGFMVNHVFPQEQLELTSAANNQGTTVPVINLPPEDRL